MAVLNRYNFTFAALLLFHLFTLSYLAQQFSISYKEALIFFEQDNLLLYTLINISTSLVGQNDLGLRLPFILFYAGSSILLYILTKDYFRFESDRLLSVFLFMLLPGVNSAALLVNESIIVVFCTLLYLYIYKIRKKECYLLLFLFLFIDNSFAIFYLALFFRSLTKKDHYLLLVSLFLFGVSMSLFGIEIGGKPKGYFIDTFSIYATIFSPLLFIYFFYSIYRIGLKHEKDLLWYLSATALGLSLLFSLRQKIAIEDFAPFVVIAIPLMVKLFMSSFRIRLKRFRKVHYSLGVTVLILLVFNFTVLIFNKYLYLFIENPKKHFAYKYHIAKEIAEQLHKLDITGIKVYDKKLQKRLLFYNIKEDSNKILYTKRISNPNNIITIDYLNKNIDTFYIVDKIK